MAEFVFSSRRSDALAVLICGGLVSGAAGVLVPAEATAELSSETEIRDYKVYGGNSRALVSYMKRRPFPGDNGPAFANIRPNYRLRLETVEAGGSCRATKADLDIRFVMTLPKAINESRMDRQTLVAWQNFRGFAKRHEEAHRGFYLACARRFLSKARRMQSPGSCAALRRAADRALKAADRDCNRLHDGFDAREIPRLPQLALFRQARVRSTPVQTARERPNAVIHAAFQFSGEPPRPATAFANRVKAGPTAGRRQKTPGKAGAAAIRNAPAVDAWFERLQSRVFDRGRDRH